jgi:hypothetical protein
MTKRLVRSSSAAALASAAILASVPAFGQEAPLPAPNVGDVWQYRRTDLWTDRLISTFEHEFAGATPDRLVYSNTASGRSIEFSREGNPCHRAIGNDAVVCDGALRFPMAIGHRHSFERPSPDRLWIESASCEVMGRESVTVPAGTFDAFRIDCDGWNTPRRQERFANRWAEQVWYAPQVHRVVRHIVLVRTWKGLLQDKFMLELTGYRPK